MPLMPSSLAPGTILDGRHRVDQPIGSGGYATVYDGFHLTLGMRVAIKVLHLDAQSSPDQQIELISSFMDEARLVTRLRHDHVVRTLDQGVLHGEAHGRPIPYVVLEWCGAESLKDRLARSVGEPIPLAEAYAIVDAVADAMAHAHGLGVVHRDIKPGNVMLAHGPSGELVPRVIDFGVAKLFENDDRPASGQTISRYAGKFTPAYAAPEQLAGLRTGPWTDVHAIGLLFFEMVTGRAPFAGSASGNSFGGASLGGVDPERPTPSRLGIDVGAFEAVIARAVALRPTDRHADAGELRRALHEAAATMDFAAPSARWTAPSRPPRKSPPPKPKDDGTSTEVPISQTARTAQVQELRALEGASAQNVGRRRATRLMPPIIAAVAALIGTTIWWTRVPRGVASDAVVGTDSLRSTSTGYETNASTASVTQLGSPTAEAISSSSGLAPPPPSTYASTSAQPSSGKPPTKIVPIPQKPASIASSKIGASSASQDLTHASPSSSGSKGVGGIIEKPPF